MLNAPTMPNAPVAGPSNAGVGTESVDDWCNKFNLGDEERQGLNKLGFRVGDKLDSLTNDVWDWAGLAPLCRMQILAAYQSSQGHN